MQQGLDFQCAEHQHPPKPQPQPPPGITAPSQEPSGKPQAGHVEDKGRVLFSCCPKNYSIGWVLPLTWGIACVLGYPGPAGDILLSLCPLPGPFINTDVPSPLTKIIHEKFNGTFLPPLSPSRFCCILDKLELHRGVKEKSSPAPGSPCILHQCPFYMVQRSFSIA